MQTIEWINVMEKQLYGMNAVVQEGYIRVKERGGNGEIFTYSKIHTFRVIVKMIIKKKWYVRIRYFNEILFHYKDVMEQRLTWWIKNFKKAMGKTLQKKDFTWVPVDKEKNSGYFSFKDSSKGIEICLDCDVVPGWTVFLCNTFEEVLEEKEVETEAEALDKANEFFHSCPTLIM